MNKINLSSNQKIILFGCGAVGKCVLHYLDDFFNFNYDNVYVIEKNMKEKEFPTVKKSIQQGINFINFEILDDNLDNLFLDILKVNPFDIVIDLTTRTNTFEIFKKVRKYSLLYINTSIEDNRRKDNYVDKSIFSQHVNLKHLDEKLKSYVKTTTLIEYGMNPGLISSFVKYGLRKLSKEVIVYQINNDCLNMDLYDAYQSNDYKQLCYILGIKVIHCSEIDTQLPNKIENENKLINTWSCLGLLDEGCDPLEITLGTHENLSKIINKIAPNNDINYTNYFEQLLMINKHGASIKLKSYVPFKKSNLDELEILEIEGRCIHHGEAISLNQFLSTETYSPTIHYVYKLNPITSKYLDEHSQDELLKIGETDNWEVLNVFNNDLNGTDNIGALFILDKNPMTLESKPYLFWTGSMLDTEYTKNVLNDIYFGPTVIQVMAGILSGLSYIVQNKELGLIFGENVPENYIIPKIQKYLGYFYCGPLNTDSFCSYNFHDLLC